MANRFQTPFPEFFNDAGEPREAARLFFYQTGTSTKLDTYSDASRTVANTNPIVLNEFGRPDVAIFLKDQDYKVVLVAPGTDDPPTSSIWTADPVRPSDIIQMSIRKTGSGSPSGLVAGTAGSAGVLPTEYWDYTNNILYECTTTGVAAVALWTAINSTSNASFFAPAGRLTLTSGSPVLAASVSSGTTVYYSPFSGNAAPIYTGTTYAMRTFTELSLTLHSSHTLNALFDVFLIDDSGVLTLVTGPAWSTSTAGAGARGTGAGTTQLTRTLGLYTNAVSMTGRNGGTTYSVGANRGLYLGTIFIDGTAGQVSCNIEYGQSRKWGVWNAYNRQPMFLKAGDSTATWTYNSGAYRASNNLTTNSLTVFSGLAEEYYNLTAHQVVTSGTVQLSGSRVGIGYNSTTVNSAAAGRFGGGGGANEQFMTARYIAPPALGINVITLLEYAQTSGNTFAGTEANSLLVAGWRS